VLAAEIRLNFTIAGGVHLLLAVVSHACARNYRAVVVFAALVLWLPA
jgi:hypothetical protein